jgi:hypothetical protein
MKFKFKFKDAFLNLATAFSNFPSFANVSPCLTNAMLCAFLAGSKFNRVSIASASLNLAIASSTFPSRAGSSAFSTSSWAYL